MVILVQSNSSKFILVHWRVTQINLKPIYINLSSGQEVDQSVSQWVSRLVCQSEIARDSQK